jgi:RNA polymerase sigma-70 factor (ECF subfamily)
MPVTSSHEQFIELFARSQRRIYAYIATLLPNSSDVEEVFQQTCLLLWRDRELFSPDSDFVRWACGIAHNRVRNFLRLRRQTDVHFSEALVDELSTNSYSKIESFDERQAALAECMAKLSDRQRDLIGQCYRTDDSMKVVADRLQINPSALYTKLHRIRTVLLECIKKAMNREALS